LYERNGGIVNLYNSSPIGFASTWSFL